MAEAGGLTAASPPTFWKEVTKGGRSGVCVGHVKKELADGHVLKLCFVDAKSLNNSTQLYQAMISPENRIMLFCVMPDGSD